MNEHAEQFFANLGIRFRSPVTDEQLDRVRALLKELLARWYAVPPGGALELAFDPKN